jgi:hypothetical protein
MLEIVDDRQDITRNLSLRTMRNRSLHLICMFSVKNWQESIAKREKMIGDRKSQQLRSDRGPTNHCRRRSCNILVESESFSAAPFS